MKLGFIDGHYPMRIKHAIHMRLGSGWIRWQLWLDLEERYGENNGPLVYQLQRAIASITQGSHTVVEYFNNLTALWDELECLKPPKTCTCGLCTCGFTRITAEEENLTKLVQFLMGLDDSYDNIRNQILVMDPFPSVNKAYSMVLRVERQRMVHTQTGDSAENVALQTKWLDNRGNNGPRNGSQNLNRGGFRGKITTDKRSQDLQTKEILAVGRVMGGLYILDETSFKSVNIQQHSVPIFPSQCNISSTEDSTWLWHKRLGHPSLHSNPYPERAIETGEKGYNREISTLREQNRLSPSFPIRLLIKQSPMTEAEKMEALKRAYAEMILNTAKEAAARVMAAELGARRLEQDLVSTKEEGARMLLRLKQIIGVKTKEAENSLLSQQRRLYELESQLNEAEGIILDLRAELNQAQEQLDEAKTHKLPSRRQN
ncbi:UNVERIFIED_CONTAM: hypothetical protein Scaly_2103200 [Sesamum calycinum]|uniref:GAG-pre-integrase domain-containing protein n=1 Tax=Sesamum calycinum TaxID=2727403 RepID=A0AAW2ML42_9LAMI